MQENNTIKLTDEELVELAGNAVIGTPSGLKAQHAQAELTRRLMESINNMNRETSKYSDRLVGLTLLLFILTLIQVIVSISSISVSWGEKLMLIILFLFIMYYFTGLVQKDIPSLKNK